MLGTGHWNGGNSVSGDRVNAWVHRATQYIALGIAVVLVAATLGILSPSRAYAASAFVQDRDTEVTSGTTASLAFSKANTAGDLIVVYVVWDNSGSATVSDTRGDAYTAATARQTWGKGWSAAGLLTCRASSEGRTQSRRHLARRSHLSASCTFTSTPVSRLPLLSTSVPQPLAPLRP